MKFSWAVLLLLVGLAIPRASQAQVSVYGQFTATQLTNDLTNNFGTDYLYGATAGVVYDGPTVLKRAILSADIQAQYGAKSSGGERLVSALVGPRLSVPFKRYKLAAYGDFLVGFGRYRDLSAGTSTLTAYSTTDSLWGAKGGVAKQLTPRLDVVAEYEYVQYGMNDGEYNPMTFGGGVIFHFVKR